MPHVKLSAELGERYLNTETDQLYNIRSFMNYLHGRVPYSVWWQDQKNLYGTDILNMHIDWILNKLYIWFAHILENIILHFWE